MFQRVLWVSLKQVLRSIALVLLPTAFITMIGWATAGSSNGNTSDPMRAAMWLWLGAHHVTFNVLLPPAGQPGYLSYLPIGALLFPLLAIRSSYARARNFFETDDRALRLFRILFSLLYAGLATLLAWGSGTHAVRPVLYLVPVMTIPIAWLAMLDLRGARVRYRGIDIALRSLAIGLGICAIAYGVALAFHISTVQNLVTVLQPGWLGGVLLLLFNLLYLPNAIVATFAYLLGPGFAVGAHTLLAPLTHRISEIPAIPLLGGLPTGRHPMLLLSAAVMFMAGVLIYILTTPSGASALGLSYLALIATVALLAYLSSGSLLTRALGDVGVSVWRMTLVVAVEITVAFFFSWAIPASMRAVRGRRAT